MTQEKEASNPAEVLKQGVDAAKIREWERAKETFQQVMEDFPDSKERVAALMKLADIQYITEEYEEAKFHYLKFIELYPAHKIVDRAHYYRSLSDFKLMETASRDQTHTRSALEGFERLIHDFPNSSFRPKAEKKRKQCLETLARSVFEIGKFYYRTASFQAAILRLNSLITQYPNQPFIDEAIFLIGESYYQEQNYGEAKNIYNRLLNNYPRSAFSKEARNRLRTLR